MTEEFKLYTKLTLREQDRAYPLRFHEPVLSQNFKSVSIIHSTLFLIFFIARVSRAYAPPDGEWYLLETPSVQTRLVTL